MSLVLFLVIALIGLGYLWFKRRFNYWTDRGFLSPPTIVPFGTMKGVASECTHAEKTAQYYMSFKGKAPAIGVYAFSAPMIVPIDLDLLKNMLVRDFTSFHDRGFYYDKKNQPVSANLLTLEGQEWRDKRVKLSPIFTSGKMKMMFDTIDSIGERLLNVINLNLQEKDVLEMRTLSAKYTGDVIGNCAFGLDCKCLEDPNSEFLYNGRKIFNITAKDMIRIMTSLIFPSMARKLGFGSFNDEPCRFFLSTFLQTFDYRLKNNIERNDFVSLLLGLKDSFTPEELAAESFLVYIGGLETSSTLLTFTMYELALNQEVQDRLRAEIVEGLEENDGKLTYDLLFGMKYLDMVINESLRKYPPIPGQNRKCTKDYEIPGTNLVIPKGTMVDVPTFAIHRDPEYYPEPDKFDPERFTPEEVKARHPFAFMPFGEGPRNCIGMRFGLMQSKLAIFKIIQHYELSPSEKTSIPMKLVAFAPFLAPVGDMHLKLKKIE